MKRLIFLLLLIPQLCFAQTMVSNRDIKQHPATKLFISGNHLVSDFEDISSSNNQITKFADTKTVNEKSTTNPKYFPVGNDKGIYFDGTGDYITTPSTEDFVFDGDFTIDYWTYKKTISEQFSYLNNSSVLNIRDSFGATGVTVNISGTPSVYGPSAMVANTWYHIAVVRYSGSIIVYINGIGGTPYSNATTLGSSLNNVVIGGITSYYHNGFIQNFRVSKGIARWTSNFTPPALNSTYATDSYTKLYIKGHDKAVNTTAMTDDSGTSKTITTIGDTKVGYSRGVASYFDGTGDYLSLSKICSDSTNSTLSVEFWWHSPNLPLYGTIIARGYRGVGDFAIEYVNPSISVYTFGSGNTYYRSISPITFSTNKWYHFAVETLRANSANNVCLYINGIRYDVTPTGVIPTWTANPGTTIGGYSAIDYHNGYITGLQVSEGIARYTENFTPPETEPVPDQYTKLLLKHKMLKISDIATNKTITINGQTMNRNFAKVGKSSLFFDGADDYLSTPYISDFDFGTGDFTLDAYIYLRASNLNMIYSGSADDGEKFLRCVIRSDTNKIGTWAGSATYEDAYTWSLNTWYHVAFIKSSNVIRHYVNGVQVGIDHADIRSLRFYPNLLIGTYYQGSYDFNGYIQDIRITKGKVLWTGNFTPPRRSGAY